MSHAMFAEENAMTSCELMERMDRTLARASDTVAFARSITSALGEAVPGCLWRWFAEAASR